MHRTIKALVRVFKCALERKYGCEIPLTSILFPWLVRRAAFVISRFLVRGDDQTAYQALKGAPYIYKLLTFGEIFRFTHHTTLIFSPSESWRLNGHFRYPHHDVSTEKKVFMAI